MTVNKKITEKQRYQKVVASNGEELKPAALESGSEAVGF